jgi:hypothetical protein
MATYRFRVTFEDYDDVTRDIEIRSTQTFEDLHTIIHSSIGFDGSKPASFYLSDDNWKKGKEITSRSIDPETKGNILLVRDTRLCDIIIDPHQKFYYVFDPESPWTFRIELIKINREEDPTSSYPKCVKSQGEAPKQYNTLNPAVLPVPEDFDLTMDGELDDEEEVEEETEELLVDDIDIPEGVEKPEFTSSDENSDEDFETADEDTADDEGGADKDDF